MPCTLSDLFLEVKIANEVRRAVMKFEPLVIFGVSIAVFGREGAFRGAGTDAVSTVDPNDSEDSG